MAVPIANTTQDYCIVPRSISSMALCCDRFGPSEVQIREPDWQWCNLNETLLEAAGSPATRQPATTFLDCLRDESDVDGYIPSACRFNGTFGEDNGANDNNGDDDDGDASSTETPTPTPTNDGVTVPTYMGAATTTHQHVSVTGVIMAVLGLVMTFGL